MRITNNLTLEQAQLAHTDALQSTEEGAEVTGAILAQLIPHLQPRVIQMHIEGMGMNKVTTLLKSNGTLWTKKWDGEWEQLRTP